MKRSLNQRYHILLGILFILIILQLIAVLLTITNSTKHIELANDIQSVMLAFTLLIFIYILVLYNYLPYRLKQSISQIEALVAEISKGNYRIDAESMLFEQEQDFEGLIKALKKMLDIIDRFDEAKAEKVYEHHQRLSQLINLIPQMVLIANISGELVYINDSFRHRYPEIGDNENLNELIIKDKDEAMVFEQICTALKYGDNIYKQETLIQKQAKIASLDGAIIRNRKGMATGGVFVLDFRDSD